MWSAKHRRFSELKALEGLQNQSMLMYTMNKPYVAKSILNLIKLLKINVQK